LIPKASAVIITAAIALIRSGIIKYISGRNMVSENKLPTVAEIRHLEVFRGVCVSFDVALNRKKLT
jgi:hypothetical protein